jgi:trehalose 6-phosphate phosphatase
VTTPRAPVPEGAAPGGAAPGGAAHGGAAGLAAIARDPRHALIALDFDGTLAPIVAEPSAARPHPDVLPALRRLAASVGTLAIITGRPAPAAVELGGFAGIPGLIVIGNHGFERWEDGRLTSPPPPPQLAAARARLPEALAEAGAPEGTRVEDKGPALVVHVRGTADPQGALTRLARPLADFADGAGLDAKPGRLVIELRPPGVNKGAALTALIAERDPSAVLFAGDDLGDLPAFEAVRAARAGGRAGVAVCSASDEVSALAACADLVVDGPEGVSALLVALADAIERGFWELQATDLQRGP